MENLFLYITHLSLKACVVIPIIAVVRFLLKRQPKSYSYALWSVVFLSLVFNIQIPPPQHSGISTPVSNIQNKLLSRYEDTLNSYTGNVQIHYTDSVEYYKALENGIKPVYDEKTDTQYVATDAVTNQAAATVSDHIPKICMLWCAGILAAVFVIIKNSLDIKSRLKYALHYRDNIYTAENIPSPFVFGIINPKIYIPESLRIKDLSYIIAHEKTHIKRKDHIIKPVCLFISVMHWFNPFVWLAFRLMCHDMEMSCDEKVISQLGSENKKAYSMLLLDFASGRNFSAAVLFGESHAENRIKNVLKYRKPAKAVALVLTAVVAVCLAFPLFSREFNSTPPAAPPTTFYEILDSRNDISHLQYKYRMGIEGNSLFPHAEYTVNVEDGSSIYDIIHKNVNYGDFPGLERKGNNFLYYELLGNRIDDEEKPKFTICFVNDNDFVIADYEQTTATSGSFIIKSKYPWNFSITQEYKNGRIVGHDKLGDELYITSVLTYGNDSGKPVTLYVIRTENGESEIMYQGEAFTITRGIRFLNENVGIASSAESNDYPTAKITLDGGKTWQNLDFSRLVPDDDKFYIRNGCIVNIYGETVEIRYHATYSGRQTHADDTYSVISFDGGLTWAGYYRGVSRDTELPGMKYEKATDTIPVMLMDNP